MNIKLLKIYATIASIFSIGFSLSIIMEIKNFATLATTSIISVFIFFVLLVNETIKVNQLKKTFNNNIKNKSIIIFTIFLSVIMSCLGIYFFTSKSKVREIEDRNKFESKVLAIKSKYNSSRDSVRNQKFINKEYTELQDNITFWQNRKCYNDNERQQARNNIYQLELKRQSLHDQNQRAIETKIAELNELEKEEIKLYNVFKKNKISQENYNFWLFIIIFALILVTEIMIVYIQYLLSRIYTPEQKCKIQILKTLLLEDRDEILMNDIKYHPSNPFIGSKDSAKTEAWSFCKNLYFLVGNLGVIDHKGKILKKKEGINILQNYFMEENQNF